MLNGDGQRVIYGKKSGALRIWVIDKVAMNWSHLNSPKSHTSTLIAPFCSLVSTFRQLFGEQRVAFLVKRWSDYTHKSSRITIWMAVIWFMIWRKIKGIYGGKGEIILSVEYHFSSAYDELSLKSTVINMELVTDQNTYRNFSCE